MVSDICLHILQLIRNCQTPKFTSLKIHLESLIKLDTFPLSYMMCNFLSTAFQTMVIKNVFFFFPCM